MKMTNTLLTKPILNFLLCGIISIGIASCGGGGQSESDSEKEHDHEEKSGEEHPNGNGEEHPDNGEEHPDDGEEHPDDGADAGQSLTIEQFADAAENYIEKKTEKNGGHFPVKDAKQDKTLKLELEKVHRKRLSHLGDDTYFVCADFEGKDGHTYDIDIFMEGTKKDNLEEAKKPMVHKVDGDERFTWHEEDGEWERKQVSSNKGDDTEEKS